MALMMSDAKARSQKLRKATVSFIMSVRLSFCPNGTIRLPGMDLHEMLYSSIVRNSVQKIQFSFKCEKKNG